MPAVTVDDLLVLPRVIANPGAEPRQVVSITSSVPGFEGEGFPVNRAFAGVSQAQTDPFLMMDQMGAVDYGPGEPKGTPWHPHRGFETVTYMIDGTFQHRDSMGGGGLIQNGATQWMTAGGGILHIEVPPEELVMSGGLFHGVQIWVNLPRTLKMTDPRYQSIEAEDVKLLTNDDGGVLLRVIAGDIGEHQGPGSTHTPIALVHATVPAGGELVLPWRADFNALVYVLSGQGSVGTKKAPIQRSQLAVFGPGETIQVNGGTSGDFDVLIMGGQPIREPIVQYGPFVMNTKAEIQQAMEDYQKGRMGQPIH
jgi:redox-sensitive bicupin YhaK (pirin superfamily)